MFPWSTELRLIGCSTELIEIQKFWLGILIPKIKSQTFCLIMMKESSSNRSESEIWYRGAARGHQRRHLRRYLQVRWKIRIKSSRNEVWNENGEFRFIELSREAWGGQIEGHNGVVHDTETESNWRSQETKEECDILSAHSISFKEAVDESLKKSIWNKIHWESIVRTDLSIDDRIWIHVEPDSYEGYYDDTHAHKISRKRIR